MDHITQERSIDIEVQKCLRHSNFKCQHETALASSICSGIAWHIRRHHPQRDTREYNSLQYSRSHPVCQCPRGPGCKSWGLPCPHHRCYRWNSNSLCFILQTWHWQWSDIIAVIKSTITDRVSTNHATIVLLEAMLDKQLLELNCNVHPLDSISSVCREALKTYT